MMASLETKLTTVLAEKTRLEEETNHWQQQYQTAFSETLWLQQSLQHSTDQLKVMERALTQQIATHQGTLATTQHELQTTIDEREDLQNQVTCLLEAVGSTQTELEYQVKEALQFQEQLVAAEKKVEDWQSVAKDRQQQITNLHKELQRSQETNHGLQNQVETLSGAAKQQVEEWTVERHNHLATIQKLNNDLVDARQQSNDLEVQYQGAMDQLKKSQTQFKEQSIEMEALKVPLESLGTLTEQVKELLLERDERKTQLEECRQELAAAKQTLEDRQAQWESTKSELDLALETRTSAWQEATQQVEVLQGRVEVAEEKLRAVRESAAAATTAHLEATRRLQDELEKERQKLSVAAVAAQKEKNSLSEQIQRLEAASELRAQEMKDMRSSTAALSKEKEQLALAEVALEEERDILQQQVATLEDEIEALCASVDGVTEALEQEQARHAEESTSLQAKMLRMQTIHEATAQRLLELENNNSKRDEEEEQDTDLQQKLDVAQEALHRAEESHAKLEAEWEEVNAELKAEIEEERRAKVALQLNVDETKGLLEAQIQQFELEMSNRADMEALLTRSRLALKEAEERCRTLEEKLAEAREIEAEKDQLADLKTVLDGAKQELFESQKKCDVLESRLGETSDLLDAKAKLMDKGKKEILDLEAMVEHTRRLLQQSEEKCHCLESKLKEATTALHTQNAQEVREISLPTELQPPTGDDEEMEMNDETLRTRLKQADHDRGRAADLQAELDLALLDIQQLEEKCRNQEERLAAAVVENPAVEVASEVQSPDILPVVLEDLEEDSHVHIQDDVLEETQHALHEAEEKCRLLERKLRDTEEAHETKIEQARECTSEEAKSRAKEVASLQDELTKLGSELETAKRNANCEARDMSSALGDEMQRLVQEREEALTEKEKAVSSSLSAQRDLVNLQQEEEKLLLKISVLTDSMEKQGLELDEARIKAQALQDELDERIQIQDSLERDHSRAEVIEKSTEEIQRLRDELAVATKQAQEDEQIYVKERKQMRERIAELEMYGDLKDNDVEDMQVELQKTRVDLVNLQSQHMSTLSEMKALKTKLSEVQDLEASKAKLMKELDNVTLEWTATKDSLARSNQQLLVLETTIEEQTALLKDATKQVEAYEADNEMLEQQLTMTKSHGKSFWQCS